MVPRKKDQNRTCISRRIMLLSRVSLNLSLDEINKCQTVLKVIREAQNQHGLKHGDHQRYQGYCSRRIRRLRKSIGMMQSTGGKTKSVYNQKKITNQHVCDASKNKKDPLRFLLIILTSAERCWALSMVLKEDSNSDHRKKFHSIRKLKKGVLYARLLQNLCSRDPTPCDARTKLESQAYYQYLNGLLHFETEQWRLASKCLKSSQTLYIKLCESVGDEASAIYRQRVHELKPTLRFCAYNLGDEGEDDVDMDIMDEKIPPEPNVAGDQETVNQDKQKEEIREKVPKKKKAPKPLFYDLALEHITLPSLEAETAAPAAPTSSRGWGMGLVKGLWGLKM